MPQPKKKKIDGRTREDIVQAAKYIKDDKKIAQYLTLPSEDISAADVAKIRRDSLATGRIAKPPRSIKPQRPESDNQDRWWRENAILGSRRMHEAFKNYGRN